MAKEAVIGFMERHNRPFSINEIHLDMKDTFGKAAVQKALNSLVEDGKIREKSYGKQKVYCITQESDASATELREILLAMDRKINDTSLQLKEVSDKLKSNTAEIGQIKGKITLREALVQKFQLEKELGEVKTELEKYSGTQTVCPKLKQKADDDYEKYICEYKKRKRICNDILNSILENYPNSKKHLYDEIGIETDEDAGFSIRP